MPTPEWTPLLTVIQMISAVASWHPEAAALDRQETLCMARNIYFEARGEGRKGQYAVAAVTLNRMRENRWPGGICAVVYQDKQFSWTISRPMSRPSRIDDRAAWQRASEVAVLSLAGLAPDHSRGATHYVAPKRLRKLPVWTGAMAVSHRIDGHVFYLERKGTRNGQDGGGLRNPARNAPHMAAIPVGAVPTEVLEMRRALNRPGGRQAPCGVTLLPSATGGVKAAMLLDAQAFSSIAWHRPANRDGPSEPVQDPLWAGLERRTRSTGARRGSCPNGGLRGQPVTSTSIREATSANPPASTAQSR